MKSPEAKNSLEHNKITKDIIKSYVNIEHRNIRLFVI